MAVSDDYRVVTTGRILDGFDLETVRKHLVSVLRLKPAQAERFFDQPRVLKKGVSWAGADKLCGQLAQLGVAAEIQSPAPPVAPPPAAPEPTLELVQDEGDQWSKPGTVECPNCQHKQEKAEQCESCGIWFHKFEPSAETTMQPASVPKPVPAAAPVQAEDNEVVTSDVVTEEGVLSPVAIAAAAGAALIGALVWKFVAVVFGYELGLIAWGIGGAVGIAAASAGSRGMQAGVVCAALALGSIVIGKYWAYAEFVDEFQQAMSGVMEYEDEMVGYFEEEMEDARLLVAGSGSDVFIRRFMVDRGYTYATNPRGVTDAELADFREYVEPELRYMAANPPDIEEWQESNAEILDDFSPWAMMREDFGILDILFIVLGVGTAFRLASQWD